MSRLISLVAVASPALILLTALPALANGSGKAFLEAAQRLTSAQSERVFSQSVRPVQNAQPPLFKWLDGGKIRLQHFSAPRGNGTGKWYQQDFDQSGKRIDFDKWTN